MWIMDDDLSAGEGCDSDVGTTLNTTSFLLLLLLLLSPPIMLFLIPPKTVYTAQSGLGTPNLRQLLNRPGRSTTLVREPTCLQQFSMPHSKF